MVSEISNCSELESPSPQAAQSLLMIVTTTPDESFAEFSNKVREFNTKEPFNFFEPSIFHGYRRVRSSSCHFFPRVSSRAYPRFDAQHVPMYAAHLFDAVILYAEALNSSIAELSASVSDAELEPEQIAELAKDGKSLFKRIKSRKYNSKSFIVPHSQFPHSKLRFVWTARRHGSVDSDRRERRLGGQLHGPRGQVQRQVPPVNARQTVDEHLPLPLRDGPRRQVRLFHQHEHAGKVFSCTETQNCPSKSFAR